METFETIIQRWPSVKVLSDDIHVKYDTVRKWKERKHIPSEFWYRVMSSARKRRIRLTYKEMAEIRGRKE